MEGTNRGPLIICAFIKVLSIAEGKEVMTHFCGQVQGMGTVVAIAAAALSGFPAESAKCDCSVAPSMVKMALLLGTERKDRSEVSFAAGTADFSLIPMGRICGEACFPRVRAAIESCGWRECGLAAGFTTYSALGTMPF